MAPKDQVHTGRTPNVGERYAADLAGVRGAGAATKDGDVPKFEEQMQVARRVMRENRGVLRELAK